MRRSATLAALVLTAAACGAADSAPHAITATSDTYIVVGHYRRIDMDHVVRSAGPLRVFERQGAGEVLVFACGDSTAGPASLFGYVTIGRKSANVRGDSRHGPASVAPRPKEG